MCLTIPGKVVAVEGAGGEDPTAIVDYEGRSRRVSLLYLPDIRPGEYLVAQGGFAIARVPAGEAEAALALARQPIPVGGGP